METQTTSEKLPLDDPYLSGTDEFLQLRYSSEDILTYDMWHGDDHETIRLSIDPPEGHTYQDIHNAPIGLMVYYRQAQKLGQLLDSPWGEALSASGFAAREEVSSLTVEYPHLDTTNGVKATVAEADHPEEAEPLMFEYFEGDYFTNEEFVAALAQGKILMSREGVQAFHDSIFHTIAWYLVPKSLQAEFIAEAQELSAARSHTDGPLDMRNSDHRQLGRHIKGLTERIDNMVSTSSALGIVDAAFACADSSYSAESSPPGLPPRLVLQLRYSAFAESDEQLEGMIDDTIARAHALQSLPQAA